MIRTTRTLLYHYHLAPLPKIHYYLIPTVPLKGHTFYKEGMFTTYVITNDIDEIYIGHTDDLFLRLKRHNGELPTKNTSYTHKHKNGEWKIVLTEEFETRTEAMKREKELKSQRGRMYIQNILRK